jgi:CDP-diacylglycerol--serine O-phosphatidyltransferase
MSGRKSNPFPIQVLLSAPNLLTLVNLLCGCLAVYAVFNFRMDLAPWLMGIALLADFFDGMLARRLGISSLIGRELDSLADVVSFGVLPGSVVFQMLMQYYQITAADDLRLVALAAPAFLLSLAAALRLAKFNLDERQMESFMGLPTPAMGFFVMSMLWLFLHNAHGWSYWLYHPAWLYSVVLVLCALMISEIPMLSFKFKSYAFGPNRMRYAFLLSALLLVVLLGSTGIFLCIPVYLLFSTANNLLNS